MVRFRYLIPLLALALPARAYMTVQLSTGVPEDVENKLLTQMVAQFNTQVVTNPFFPNTYQVFVYGTNPNYNPPPTNIDLLNALVTVDSYTYVYGWADAIAYHQHLDTTEETNYLVNCSSPTYFNLVTIDSTTCTNVVSKFMTYILNQKWGQPIPPTTGDF